MRNESYDDWEWCASAAKNTKFQTSNETTNIPSHPNHPPTILHAQERPINSLTSRMPVLKPSSVGPSQPRYISRAYMAMNPSPCFVSLRPSHTTHTRWTGLRIQISRFPPKEVYALRVWMYRLSCPLCSQNEDSC